MKTNSCFESKTSKRRYLLKLAAIALATTTVVSCGSGDGTGLNDGGGSNPGLLEPDFASIQTNVFDQLCVSCHIGATAPAGLRLDAANSYALLVGFPSVQEPGLLRVDPGDPDASYLVQKLEGTAGTGEQMPLSAAPMPAADIAVVRQWISDGAMRAPAPVPTDPIRVSSLSPLPDSVTLRLPMSIIAMFDREVDANTVNDTTFLVERSGGDGTFDDGNEVSIAPLSVTVPASNTSSAVLDLSNVPSVEDTYRITLVGSGAAVIADLDANALDGEFSGTLPSGDGTAGGDFVAEFAVEGVQPTLTSIQENVFTVSCAGCHNGGSATLPGSLDLTSEAQSFANLVGIASALVPTRDRVAAGDSASSFLIEKLLPSPSAGQQMPLFLTPLDQETVDAISEWIDNGANQ